MSPVVELDSDKAISRSPSQSVSFKRGLYSEGILGKNFRIKYVWDGYTVHLYRRESRSKVPCYSFSGLNLIAEIEWVFLLKIFEAASDCMDVRVGPTETLEIKPEHVDLVRIVFSHERSFNNGLLGMLVLKSILEGFLVSKDLVRQILDHQKFVGSEHIGRIGHLLPTFSNGVLGYRWTQYEDSIKFLDNIGLNAVVDKSGCVETLIRICHFSFEGVNDSELTWGDFLDSPVNFKAAQHLVENCPESKNPIALMAFEVLFPLVTDERSETITLKEFKGMNIHGLKIYSKQKKFICDSIKEYVISKFMLFQDDLETLEGTFHVPEIIAESDENWTPFNEARSKMEEAGVVFNHSYVKFAASYIVSTYGIDALHDFRDLCINISDSKYEPFLRVNDFMEDVLETFSSGLAFEMNLEMALRIEAPKWFETV